ncbi:MULTISPECIES: FadR/GntR family transcriptional regulator [unclassified Halomonas]|uniref:FadR/GntR family transcriptional regulator n=1 Tax=unclassified Halomonas TaxID=2609666 RepID=UPI0021E3E4F6|nr:MULTISPECIES: FadR/GntR family transcriptional regulator [unclassified Halomonas]UYG00750.1 FadR family transcriptional regulator [Halomonas sp. GD1P12]WNL41494.1 FadR/GntR family transcriptional regulator [Halomonas sp. PAMB 3264]
MARPTSEIAAFNVKRVTQKGSLAVNVADQLEALIVQGKVAVGDKLPTENSLCDSFGVSRTVIREAITHLKSLGLVETRRGVGTSVLRASKVEALPAERINPTTVEDILHLLELRLAIEPAAAEHAALRHDDDDKGRLEKQHRAFENACAARSQAREEDYLFHFAIAQATKNPFFQSFYEQWSQSVIPRAKLVSSEINPLSSQRYLERVQEEHTRILEAILARDSKAAYKAMQQHLGRARDTYAQYRDQT